MFSSVFDVHYYLLFSMYMLFPCVFTLIIHFSAWSSDSIPGLLLVWGAGRHGCVAVGGPSHPPPHTRTKPHLWLARDASARMTSAWAQFPQPDYTSQPCIILVLKNWNLSASVDRWLSTDSLRRFLPERGDVSQSLNGGWTECIPLWIISTLMSTLRFLYSIIFARMKERFSFIVWPGVSRTVWYTLISIQFSHTLILSACLRMFCEIRISRNVRHD